MRKGMRFLLFSVSAFVFTFLTTTNVFAAQTKYYDATIPAMNNGYLPYVTANANYRNSMNYVIDKVGGATVHSYYQTKFNGNNVTIGNVLSMSVDYKNRVLLWYPSGNSSNPSGYTVHAKKQCSGDNVTASWCVVQSSQYRLRLQNQNVFNKFDVYGAMIFQ